MIYAENILICIALPLVLSLLFVRGKAGKFVLSFLIGMVMSLILLISVAFFGGFPD